MVKQLFRVELTQKIFDLKFKTHRLMKSFLKGSAKSKTGSIGGDFNQIREYFLGDDVRLIDWRSSAKVGSLLLRQYNEDKKYTVLIAVDISMSQHCGGIESKLDLAREVASIIAAACQFFRDQVSLVLFTDEVEKHIDFSEGRFQTIKIMSMLYQYTPRGTRTNIAKALRFIGSLQKKDVIVFIISDFVDTGYQKELRVLSRKYECVAIVCENRYEAQFPSFGFLTVRDPETNRKALLDLRVEDSELNNYLKWYKRNKREGFKKCNVRYLFLPTKNDVYVELIVLFNKTIRNILPPEWAYE